MAYYTELNACFCPEVNCIPIYEPLPPPSYSKKYSPEISLYCLNLVVNLYTSVYEEKPLQKTPGAKLIKLFSLPNPEAAPNTAALFKVGKTLYLIFRGTIGEEELALDLDITQIPYGQELGPPSCLNGEVALVHRGIATLYSGVANQIRETLDQTGFKHLFIAGHSLGASLATLAAYDLGTSYRLQTYAFGTLRTGNMVFSNLMRERVPRFYNIQNENDFIVHYPPAVVTIGDKSLFYQHCGKVYLFRENWLSYSGNHSFNIYRENVTSCDNMIMLENVCDKKRNGKFD